MPNTLPAQCYLFTQQHLCTIYVNECRVNVIFAVFFFYLFFSFFEVDKNRNSSAKRRTRSNLQKSVGLMQVWKFNSRFSCLTRNVVKFRIKLTKRCVELQKSLAGFYPTHAVLFLSDSVLFACRSEQCVYPLLQRQY